MTEADPGGAGEILSPAPKLKAMLPFNDDSTLFFARRMLGVLKGSGIDADTVWLAQGSDLSPRQMSASLPNGADVLMRNDAFKRVGVLHEYDLILTSRMFPPLRDMLRDPFSRCRADRPAVCAFQGGLDFDAERGFFNRRFADAVFIVPTRDIKRYRTTMAAQGLAGPQYIGFGHPTFLEPKTPPDRTVKDIYFFTQAISPLTYRSRLYMVKILATLARAYPDRTVWLKLRHLPSENTAHLHKEEHPYPDLITALGATDLPNLKVTADPMEAVLPNVGIGITCTSTAAVDLIRAGIPTMLYLDYVENYLDPLVNPMRALFETSGLIVPLDNILNLAPQPARAAWIDGMFCSKDRLIAQIFEAHAHFKARTDLTTRILPVPLDRANAPEDAKA
ncbi:MAG: DUF6716 putative glycosyltransferase [Pseudomonadota bacterium]